MTTYKVHPLAEIFPPFSDKEFQDLVADIGENGQRNVITLFEGKILDGVHRYKACLKLNMEPRVRVYSGKDALGFAVSANLKRRHLNESQRALIAAQLSGSKNGRPGADRSQLTTVSNKRAAEMLNVSEMSVDRAKSVLKDAPKEDVEAVRAGKVAVSGSGENGAADLWPTRRFADIALLPETVRARGTWARFVAWCKERQLEIPADADLWIVTTETA